MSRISGILGKNIDLKELEESKSIKSGQFGGAKSSLDTVSAPKPIIPKLFSSSDPLANRLNKYSPTISEPVAPLKISNGLSARQEQTRIDNLNRIRNRNTPSIAPRTDLVPTSQQQLSVFKPKDVEINLQNLQPKTPQEQARVDSFLQRESDYNIKKDYDKLSPVNKVLNKAMMSFAKSGEADRQAQVGLVRGMPFGDSIISDETKKYIDENPVYNKKFTPNILGKEFEINVNPQGVAKVASTLGFTAVQYGAINKALQGVSATSKLGTLLGGSKWAKIGATQAVDLAADIIIQTPQEVFRAIDNDDSLGTFAKDTLKNRGIDILLNGLIGGAIELSTLKKLKAEQPEVIEQMLKKANPEQTKIIQQELGLPLETTAKDMLDESKTIADEIELENFYKQYEQPTSKISKILQGDDTLKTVDDTVKPNQVSNMDIEKPKTETAKTFVNLDDGPNKMIAKGEPINTKDLITTELPSTPKDSLKYKKERFLQETVSKMLPTERIGGITRVKGANLNKAIGNIEYNVIGKQTNMNGDDIGKSVKEIFENVKTKDKTDLFDYVFHKHNIDRANQGKPVFGETIDSEYSKNFVKEFEAKNPNALQTQQEITKYFNNLLREWGVNSGLVSKETADLLDDMYKNYVPTIRVKNLPQSLSSGNRTVSQVLKKAKGSEDKILPLDQMMIMQTDRIIKNARKNEVLNSVADAFEKGDTIAKSYVKEIKGSKKELLDDAFDIGKNLEKDAESLGQDYILNYYKNGEPKEMVVDKILYEAFKPQNLDNVVGQVAGMIKKYATNPFKSLITEFNPAFSVANIMRDIPTALAFSDNALNMTKKVPTAVKEMLTDGVNWRKFKALGGTREGIIGSGKAYKVPTVGSKSTFSKIGSAAKKANPFNVISNVNNFTESLPRFAEFLAVLEKTNNPAIAIYKSADLTTDFARHGNATKLIDSIIPYLNPQVQGMDKFARSIVANPLKTAIGAGGAITVPTIILDQINKDDKDYNNLSSRERNMYFQIPYTDKNGEKQFLRIPKSRELGVLFSSLFDWGARTARGEKVTGEEMYQAYTENFGVSLDPIWTDAMKAIKQIKDPDAYETNFWDSLIVPYSQRKYSPGEQYDLNSSGIAKAFGKQFNISPYVVDFLLSSYGGVLAQFIQPIGADRKKELLEPLTKRFMTDPVYKSDSTNKFYTLLDKTKKEAQDYNKINNIPSKVVTQLEKEASRLNKISLEMTNIRKEMKKLQVEKGNDEKLRELQKIINSMAEKAVERSK